MVAQLLMNPFRLLSVVLVVTAAPSLLSAAPAVIPSPPTLEAGAYILVDAFSGQVFAEGNPDARMEPASLTKIMTAYVAFRALRQGDAKLTDPVHISEKAWRTGGSRTFLEVGNDVPLEVILKGMIIQSGNDASVALAEHLAGTEQAFADLMNHEAKQLGMTGTHFVNATGLPESDHYTTARDMATLARALIREFPDYYKWFSEKEFTYNGITQHNRDRLLWRDDSVDGIKTGFTDNAGYCLVSSAVRDGMRLISVVMKTKSTGARTRQAKALLDYGFRFFETHRLYTAGKSLDSKRVWRGAETTVPVGTKDDVYVTVPRGQYDKLSASLEIQDQVMAPVAKDQPLGAVHVTLPDGKVVNYPLVALAEVPEGGIFRRGVDSVLLWFQ